MAQPSVASFFNTRKRPAADDVQVRAARKVLVLEEDRPTQAVEKLVDARDHPDKLNNNKLHEVPKIPGMGEIKVVSMPAAMATVRKKAAVPRRKLSTGARQGNIEQLLSNMSKTPTSEPAEKAPPAAPTKKPAAEPSLAKLEQKLSRSSRLAELRASIARFKQADKKLEAAEKKTAQAKESPTLKNFKALELEVHLSPTKAPPQSPEKPYLSPKKEATVRRNLFGLHSPTKADLSVVTSGKESLLPVRESLALPYKYRCLAEIFRSIDTVSQILYNRKETITFKKLKPAVEQMLKRTFSEKHLKQIKFLYEEAFDLQWEKLRDFGSGTRREQWELVVTPQLQQQVMTSEVLLERRRKLYNILIQRLKRYHKEFLATLDPPMHIHPDKIARWHPEFDIEKVPDVELYLLPPAPFEEKLTTGSEVLQKARAMFGCNTRMERALEKLKESKEAQANVEVSEGSVLKGVPKSLLEKVRQRQAAKALESMTRSSDKERELRLYSQLPEVARLARNLFVAERKGVMPLDVVLDKLCNSYRAFSDQKDMEAYLRTISKEVNGWLVFAEINGVIYIKLAKNADFNMVTNKLKSLIDQRKFAV